MNLTPHFTLDEMTVTQTGLDNTPNQDEIEALRMLCEKVLEPLREQFGIIDVRSGYRSEAVNTQVGGEKKSQHRKGEAADIVAREATIQELAAYALDNLPIDQVILEPGWVHVSYGPRHRGQGLIWVGQGQYIPVNNSDDFRRRL